MTIAPIRTPSLARSLRRLILSMAGALVALAGMLATVATTSMVLILVALVAAPFIAAGGLVILFLWALVS